MLPILISEKWETHVRDYRMDYLRRVAELKNFASNVLMKLIQRNKVRTVTLQTTIATVEIAIVAPGSLSHT